MFAGSMFRRALILGKKLALQLFPHFFRWDQMRVLFFSNIPTHIPNVQLEENRNGTSRASDFSVRPTIARVNQT